MKDFERWHNLKCEIDAGRVAPPFNEREIWWCSVGTNVGVEEDGKNDLFERPVLVVRKFNHEMFWGVPLTSKVKEGAPYHFLTVRGQLRTALLQQLRLYSSKRLMHCIDKIMDSSFQEVKYRLAEILEVNKNTAPRSDERGARSPNGKSTIIIPELTDSSNNI
jgi:mRNA interferase MazF